MILEDSWTGLYREGWGRNRLRPASFAHPAKCSYGLSVRIYEHALEQGWVKPGDYVVDCFSGIGGFALEAMRHGLHFVGVELEQRFVDMAQGCDCTGIGKEDWVRFQGRWDRMRYEGGRHWCPECLMKAAVVAGEREFKVAKKRKIKPLPLPGTKWGVLAKARQPVFFDAAPTASYVRNSGKIPCTGAHHYRGNVETWAAQGMPGTALIVQGDSRRLGEVLERASLCLSSPPYADLGTKTGKVDETAWSDGRPRAIGPSQKESAGYGNNPLNLGNLPDTGFEAALAMSSPVYIGNTASDDPDKRGGLYRDPKRRNDKTLTATYSEDEAQLAQMPEGSHEAALAEPGHVAPGKPARAVETPQSMLEVNQEMPALALGSPPYAGSLGDGKSGIDWSKQADRETVHPHGWDGKGYGKENGQLAALPEGDHAEACERPVCAISSPPYIGTPVSAQGADGKSQEWNKAYREYRRTGDHAKFQAQMTEKCDKAGYGSKEGQLAQMPPGDHAEALEAGAVTGRAELCLSSPPHMSTTCRGAQDPLFAHKFRGDQRYSDEDPRDPRHTLGGDRNSPKVVAAREARAAATRNLGEIVVDSGATGLQHTATFWAASREILEQVYQVLAPGAHAIFVCKRFVRAKKIVDFPLQWAHLCEAVGFTWIHHHKAWLVEDRGAQHTLDGGLEERQVKRFSFFRRLHSQKYPELEISYEDVLCFVKE